MKYSHVGKPNLLATLFFEVVLVLFFSSIFWLVLSFGLEKVNSGDVETEPSLVIEEEGIIIESKTTPDVLKKYLLQPSKEETLRLNQQMAESSQVVIPQEGNETLGIDLRQEGSYVAQSGTAPGDFQGLLKPHQIIEKHFEQKQQLLERQKIEREAYIEAFVANAKQAGVKVRVNKNWDIVELGKIP